MFGGLRADRLVSEQVLYCLRPLTIQAAIEAIDSLQSSSDERIRHKQLALEQARHEVAHARRQYDSVDPSNRLVASELERRWNEALRAQAQIESELTALQSERPDSLKDSTKRELLALAQDVPDLWNHPKSSPEHKKHILRAVLKEIIAISHGDSIQLLLHWQGGEHTQLQLPKTRTGHHRYVIATDTIDLVRALARVQPDAMIVSILNRAGCALRTGRVGHQSMYARCDTITRSPSTATRSENRAVNCLLAKWRHSRSHSECFDETDSTQTVARHEDVCECAVDRTQGRSREVFRGAHSRRDRKSG